MTRRSVSAPHQTATLFERLEGELWLAKRLGEHGAEIFTGDTDERERRLRFRHAIQLNGLDMVQCGPSKATGGKSETYAEVFKRIYGERL